MIGAARGLDYLHEGVPEVQVALSETLNSEPNHVNHAHNFLAEFVFKNFEEYRDCVISGQDLIQSFGVAGDLQGFQSVQHPSRRRIQAKTVGFWPGKGGSNRRENTRLHRGACS